MSRVDWRAKRIKQSFGRFLFLRDCPENRFEIFTLICDRRSRGYLELDMTATEVTESAL